jgi:hypothetical protein
MIQKCKGNHEDKKARKRRANEKEKENVFFVSSWFRGCILVVAGPSTLILSLSKDERSGHA